MTTDAQRAALFGALVVGLIGGLVVVSLNGSGQILLADGGAYDGSIFGLVLGADASVAINCNQGDPICTTVTASGYADLAVAWDDAGHAQFGAVQAFACRCASTEGPCLFADGGQVSTGTYPASQVSGSGCLARPCVELASSPLGEFSAAPPDCAAFAAGAPIDAGSPDGGIGGGSDAGLIASILDAGQALLDSGLGLGL